MAKKLAERKHSQYVADKVLDALRPFRHLTQEQIDQIKDEFASLPEHIRLLRQGRISMAAALRGYSDSDVERLIEAEKLVRLEQGMPEVFASSLVGKAIRSDTTRNQDKRRKGSSFTPLIDEILAELVREKGTESLANTTDQTIATWVETRWMHRYETLGPPARITIKRRIKKLIS